MRPGCLNAPGFTTGTEPGRLKIPVLRSLFVLAFVTLTALGGCGGAQFDGAVYRGKGFAFRVGPLPPTWKRIDVSNGGLAFRDTAAAATVAVNGRCGVDGEDVPLGALTQHLFLAFTQREILEQKVVPLDGREAMNTVLVAKLDGVPKKFDVWVLKKDGCVYDLYYIAPPDRFDRGVVAFDRFVQGFATVPDHAD
jgi:hypothetical protein